MAICPAVSVDPICATQSVQNVTAHRMPDRQTGVIEVVGRIVVHSQSLHDRAGSGVCRGGKTDDAVQAHRVEPPAYRGARSLGRVTKPPGRPRKAPTDLDRRCKVRREFLTVQSCETDERAALYLNGKPAKPSFCPEPPGPLDHRVAFVRG